MNKRIFVVGDQTLMQRRGLLLLRSEHGFEICGVAATAEDAFTHLRRLCPHVVIADLALDGMNGVELTKRLQSERTEICIIIVSLHAETIYAERALRAGAKGFITFNELDEVIMDALRRVLDGKHYLSEAMSVRMVQQYWRRSVQPERGSIENLSDRELEVFEMLGRGLSTGEVAAALSISPKTVESHRGRIKRKLAITSTTELVRQSERWMSDRRI